MVDFRRAKTFLKSSKTISALKQPKFWLIKSIYEQWMKSLQMKFIDYNRSRFLAYSFEADQTVVIFNRQKRRFFSILPFVIVFDMCKMLLNAILNENQIRLYIFDFVCTWSKYQALFNYSVIGCYVFLLRLHVYFFLTDREENSKKFSYLNFLRVSTEKELVKKHLLSRKAAKRYLFFVDLLMKVTQLNGPLYFLGELF